MPAPGILSVADCKGFPLANPPAPDASSFCASPEDLMKPLPAFLDAKDGTPVFYPHGAPIPSGGQRREISELVVPTVAAKPVGADTGKPSLRTMFMTQSSPRQDVPAGALMLFRYSYA
jgi:hypothetical protein